MILIYSGLNFLAGAYIAVLIGGNTFKWKFIERDDEIISMLIKLEKDFWEHVENEVPPALDGSDASAKFLAERFPDSIPKSKIELPENAEELIAEYNSACEKLEGITEQKQTAENQLKEMLGENEVGTSGNSIITWKSMSQERLDSKTLKAEHPKLYAKYVNIISYRRFSIKAV